MKPLTIAVVVVALFVAASCSNDRPRDTGAPPSPASPSSPPFVNGGDCPLDPSRPKNVGCASTATADGEVLTVYARLNKSSRPGSWRMQLDTAHGPIDQPLRAGNDFSYPRVVGAADLDSDGKAEWWVKVVDYTSHGAPWSGLNVFFAKGRSLVPLSFEGKPFVINYGGIARLGEGAKCDPSGLSLLRAEAANRINTRWEVSERRYHLAGTKAHLLDRKETTLTISDYNDPALDPYYRVDCNGFVFPS